MEAINLFDSLNRLSTPVKRTCPETMEEIGQDYGFIYYETTVSGPRENAKLALLDVHDRALVYLGGKYMGSVERWNQQEILLDIPKEGAKLGILVENMGRINYGPLLKDYKGITEGVCLNSQYLFDWTIYSLPLKELTALNFSDASDAQTGPAFYKGVFFIDKPADTFLNFNGWTKGVAYINGFNLGRYWEIGPQETLYIPAPLLKKGKNEIIMFELHEMKKASIYLSDTPVLDKVMLVNH